jgi:hypothetical protein
VIIIFPALIYFVLMSFGIKKERLNHEQ